MKYYIPPKHEQKHIIANTPEWLREYFKEEAQEVVDVWNQIDYLKKVTDNPNRKKIINILKGVKKPLNISELSRKMNISYKSVYKNIKILEKYGVVTLKKDPLASGQAVTVEFNKKAIKEQFDKMRKRIR